MLKDAPAPPPGFVIDDEPAAPPPAPRGLFGRGRRAPVQPVSGSPTGQVHDGDTFRLSSGPNARLFGVDAFELDQPARTMAGAPYPIGDDARAALMPFAQPASSISAAGAPSYGRPVVTLDGAAGDAGESLISKGLAIPDLRYLAADRPRADNYVAAQRQAIAGEAGAYAGTYQMPQDYRKQGEQAPWTGRIVMRPDEAAQWESLIRNPTTTPEQAGVWLARQGHSAENIGNLVRFLSRNPEAEANPAFQQRDAAGNPVQAEPRGLMLRALDAINEGIIDIPAAPFDLSHMLMKPIGEALGVQMGESSAVSDWMRDTYHGAGLGQRDEGSAPRSDLERYAQSFLRGAGSAAIPVGGSLSLGGKLATRAPSAFTQASAARTAIRDGLVDAAKNPGTAAALEIGSGAGSYLGEEAAHDLAPGNPYAAIAGQVIGGLGGGFAAGAGTRRSGSHSTGDRVVSTDALDRPLTELDPAAPMVERDGALFAKTPDGRDLPIPVDPSGHPGVTWTEDGWQALVGVKDGASQYGIVGQANSIPSRYADLARQLNGQPRPRDVIPIPPSGPAPEWPSSPPVNTAPPVRPQPQPQGAEDVARAVEPWATDAGARPADGSIPDVMLHGSPQGSISEFDPYGRSGYGLFGMGTYLTDNPGIAASYTKKGAKRLGGDADRSVYAVRQSVKNPLDMDASANRAEWEAVAGKVLGEGEGEFFSDIPDGAPNEAFWRSVEDYLSSEQVTASEGAETMDALVRSLGRDGITHIGGGRVGNGPRHRVVIALDPEQTSVIDRLSIEQMVNPRAPRSPDWIDIAQQPAASGGIERPPILRNSSDGLPPPPAGFVLDQPTAAMASGIGASTLNGPRVVDRIDLSAPTPRQLSSIERVASDNVPEAAAIVGRPDQDGRTRAGNINLANLDSPQSIDRALQAASDATGGFADNRRGVISHAETERLAGEMGMTADDLLKRRKGQAINAEQALAARQILAKSGDELVTLAQRVQSLENPGDELLAQFRQAWVRHVAIQDQVAGATAEAGRALSQFRMMADSRLAKGQVLSGLVHEGGGADRLKDAARIIIDSADDPSILNRVTARTLKPKFSDKLVELWYNSLLSGPQTHAVNIMSNTMTALAQIPEHMVAAGVGAVRRALPSQRDTDAVLFSEVGARAAGLLQGTKEGLAQSWRTFRTGEPSDFMSKVETRHPAAISGIKGSVIRTPTRALAAEDELFKAMARRMELSGLAFRQAAKEGLKGDAAKARVGELMANPTDAMLDRSFKYGQYLTFQSDLGPIGQGVTKITQSMPVLKLVLPFIKTPTNLLKFTIERAPVAPILKEWRTDFRAGGDRRDLAVAKAMVGSGMMALVTEMVAQGAITGGGPADEGAKSIMRADGWQPYSLKIGDRFYSYQRMDPFASTIGIAADLVDLQGHMTEKQRDEMATLLVGATLKNLSNKTWLSGITDLTEAINDPDRSAQRFLARMAGSIAVPAGVAQVARTTDPVLREAKSELDRIRSRIPGMSQSLLPKRDVWGQPIMSEGGLGPDIVSPVWTSTARNDSINRAMLDAGAHVGQPKDEVYGRKLSPQEFGAYRDQIGRDARRQLEPLISSPSWQTLPAYERQEILDDVLRKARRGTREGMFGAPPGRASGESIPPPPGFVLDK